MIGAVADELQKLTVPRLEEDQSSQSPDVRGTLESLPDETPTAASSDCESECAWRAGLSTFMSFGHCPCVLLVFGGQEMERSSCMAVGDSIPTAENVALGDGWLTGLGFLVADRVSGDLSAGRSVGPIQPFTARRLETTDLCSCPVCRTCGTAS